MTPEQRALYDAEIARSREALDYWRANAPESYSPTTAARVAAADQLAGCEALLRAIGAELIGDNRHWMLWERDRKLGWSGKIAALGLAP